MITEYKKTLEWPILPTSQEETLSMLKQTPTLFTQYDHLSKKWKTFFHEFIEGKKSLPLTYDPFFKRIFHPDIHADRLESLISSLLNTNVKIVAILPNEDSMLAEESLLIMDLLVELEDSSLCNVEIQRQAYAFPAERISCYSSDLLMRQYTRVKGERGKSFTYRDIKKVFVIVIYEQSTKIFHKHPNYIHYGKTVFDTKLELQLLQEYCLVALDVFSKITYPKEKSIQTAWLSLLATDSMEDMERLISEYPWVEEIYREIAILRHKPEEVLGMCSEALRILDENTLKYLVEELQKTIDDDKIIIAEKAIALAEKNAALAEKDAALAERDAALAERDAALAERDSVLTKQADEIAKLKYQLAKGLK